MAPAPRGSPTGQVRGASARAAKASPRAKQTGDKQASPRAKPTTPEKASPRDKQAPRREPPGEFVMTVDKPRALSMGLGIRVSDDNEMVVDAINEGVAKEWNKKQAEKGDQCVEPGDIIVKVNEVSGDAKKMLNAIKTQTHLAVTLQRPGKASPLDRLVADARKSVAPPPQSSSAQLADVMAARKHLKVGQQKGSPNSDRGSFQDSRGSFQLKGRPSRVGPSPPTENVMDMYKKQFFAGPIPDGFAGFVGVEPASSSSTSVGRDENSLSPSPDATSRASSRHSQLSQPGGRGARERSGSVRGGARERSGSVRGGARERSGSVQSRRGRDRSATSGASSRSQSRVSPMRIAGAKAKVALLRKALLERFGSPKGIMQALDTNHNGVLTQSEVLESCERFHIPWKRITGAHFTKDLFIGNALDVNTLAYPQEGDDDYVVLPKKEELLNTEAAQAFFDWCARGGHWPRLTCLFDSTAIVHSCANYIDASGIRLQTRQKLFRKEFVRVCKCFGFKGDCDAVFTMIQKETFSVADEEEREVRGSTRSDDYITLRQLKRFETRLHCQYKLLKPVDQCSPVARFADILRQKRGSLLRAWRLDVDLHQTGKVTAVHFGRALRAMNMHAQLRPIWRCLRPDGSPHALNFQELGEVALPEAEAVQEFAAVLWAKSALDMDRVWLALDPGRRGWLCIDEFRGGCQLLGFQGDVDLLWRCLSMNHRISKQDLEYIPLITEVGKEQLDGCPRLMQELLAWTNLELGGLNELIAKLGLTKARPDIASSDMTARLVALGFQGDARWVSWRAARGNDGCTVTANSLKLLFAGDGRPPTQDAAKWPLLGHSQPGLMLDGRPRSRSRSATPPPRSRQRSQTPPRSGHGELHKVGWNPSVPDVETFNRRNPRGTREYFSKSVSDATYLRQEATMQPRSLSRRRSLQIEFQRADSLSGRSVQASLAERPSQDAAMRSASQRAALIRRPAWNDSVVDLSTRNVRWCRSERVYFSNASLKPARENIARRLEVTHLARSLSRERDRSVGELSDGSERSKRSTKSTHSTRESRFTGSAGFSTRSRFRPDSPPTTNRVRSLKAYTPKAAADDSESDSDGVEFM
eukprot:TRINITY_DN20785_c0_g1_i1.p1 TRINITY_DN20785_c0_g1~~TRINITY_DN20785_c0_g1_i1.p1  ORF type:complete len:1097 (+),score=205.48 TRINITY_DN20785_c0_g1_i1:149-3439(+)